MKKIIFKLLHVIYMAYMAIIFILFLITSTIFSSLVLLIMKKKAHKPMMWCYKNWARIFFFMGFIRITIEGKEHLDNAVPCIVVSNHGTNLDMFLGAYSMPLLVKPLAKVELKKVPLLGFLFSTVCVLVDRKSRESREKSSRQLIKEIRNKVSIFIYPEGTRNKGKEPLNKFYDGAFRFAIEGGFPILAMCTIGGRAIGPSENYTLKPGKVKIIFLPVYESSAYNTKQIDELKDKVWQDMHDVIKANDPMFT